MAEFCMEIAGYRIAVSSVFDSTKDYCIRYLTDGVPEFSVAVTREDMEREQQLAYKEALEEGFRPRVFTDPFLDRAVIQRKIAEQLLDRDVLLFHGSAVAVDGQGYLFAAKSGTGKSTHTRYWMEAFGSRAIMVNDDKPFLRMEKDSVMLCGAPWSGKHGLDTNIVVPLAGICILERGEENRIQPITPQEALPMLMQQSQRPQNRKNLLKYMELVDQLSQKTEFYRMSCNMDPEAAVVAYEAMSGKRKED